MVFIIVQTIYFEHINHFIIENNPKILSVLSNHHGGQNNNTYYLFICVINIFMRILLSFLSMASILSTTSFSQVRWDNMTQSYLRDIQTRSTNTGVITDINGDLVDDIIIMDRGQWAKWVQSSGKNQSLQIIDSIRTTQTVEWSICAGDFDNSGTLEFLTIGNSNNLKRIKPENHHLTLSLQPLNIYAQASNTVDINNDGWLDYYVCDDLGPNVTMLNNGVGELILTEMIDFLLNDPTDGSGNYGSEWVDVNGDLLPDLCIAKCSAFATEPTDPRRINRIYINQGDGTFVEKAEELGMASGAQSWVNAFGDFDNDGDQDAIIINHYSPHQIMENINGEFFTDISPEESISSFGLQAVMRDFDNDGYLDIFIAGVEGDLFLHNKGDKTFKPQWLNFGPSRATSFVVGDLNDDGFMDIFAMMGQAINNVGSENDQLWVGIPNGHHFFKVNLEGRTSNRMGIGAQVELYGGWGRQTRYVKGGESYGIFNSVQQHFGLNQHTRIDSLIIRWPSGITDKYTDNLTINSTVLAQEGLCLTPHIALSDTVLIYRNQPLQVSAPDGFDAYLWNDGSTNPTINVVEGNYFVTMADSIGCKTISRPVRVISGCFSDEKLIQAESHVVRCQGETIPLLAVHAESYIWSDGSSESFVIPREDGWLYLTAQDYCQQTRTDSVHITIKNLNYKLEGDSIQKGQRAVLTSTHANTRWFDNSGENLLFTGSEFTTDPLDTTTVFVAQVRDVTVTKSGRLGERLFPTTNLYGNNNTSGDMIFDVIRPCIIKSVSVNTDTEGVRRVLILDNEKNVVYSEDFDIKAGITTLGLNVLLEEGRYALLTDIDVNRNSLGFRSPRLVRTFNNTTYPYQIEKALNIIGSSAGSIYYFYFYDWVVDYDLTTCESPPEPVTVFVDNSSLSENTAPSSISLYPNPTSTEFRIKTDKPVQKIEVYHIHGQKIYGISDTGQSWVETQHWPPGLYFVHIFTTNERRVFKILKI